MMVLVVAQTRTPRRTRQDTDKHTDTDTITQAHDHGMKNYTILSIYRSLDPAAGENT